MSMNPGVRRAIVAFLIGIAATATLYGVSSLAYRAGNRDLARALYWQGPALQSLVRGVNVGTAEHPIMEGTPVHFALFYAGLPLGVLIYSVVAFSFLPKRRTTGRLPGK